MKCSDPVKKNNKRIFHSEGIPAGFELDSGEQLRCRTWWKITRSLARRFGSLSLPARIKTTTCTLEYLFSLPGKGKKVEMVFVHRNRSAEG